MPYALFESFIGSDFMFEELTQQAKTAVLEIIEQAKIGKGSIFVVGCSSSTVKGENYGKASSMEIAQAILMEFIPNLNQGGFSLRLNAVSI